MLPSENESYGFFGTVNLNKGRPAAKAEWATAFRTLERWAPEDATEEHIQKFLDSKYGRWLADRVVSGTTVADYIKKESKSFLKSLREIMNLVNRGEL